MYIDIEENTEGDTAEDTVVRHFDNFSDSSTENTENTRNKGGRGSTNHTAITSSCNNIILQECIDRLDKSLPAILSTEPMSVKIWKELVGVLVTALQPLYPTYLTLYFSHPHHPQSLTVAKPWLDQHLYFSHPYLLQTTSSPSRFDRHIDHAIPRCYIVQCHSHRNRRWRVYYV